MPEAPVVVDNTPLVALWRLHRLDLVASLFGDVVVPPAVYEEFLAIDRKERTHAIEERSWISVNSPENPRRALAFAGLDRGEAEVLALAEERRARLIVADDKQARRYARRLGFPLTGTLGVLILAKEQGLIPSVTAEISRLQDHGLYLGADVVARAKELAGE